MHLNNCTATIAFMVVEGNASVQPLPLKNCEKISFTREKFPDPQSALNSLARTPSQLVQLQVLNVNGYASASNPITYRNFMQVLKGATNLRVLDATYNSITPKHMAMMKDAILDRQASVNVVLEALILNFNDLKERGAFILSEVVKSCPNLKKLHFYENCIGSRGIGAIFSSIALHQKVESLDFGCNAEFDSEEIIGDLIFSLLTHAKSLSDLIADNSYLGEYSACQISKALAFRIQNAGFAALTSLDIAKNTFNRQAIYNIFSGTWLSQIRSLDLSDNLLGDEGISMISSSLMAYNANELSELKLRQNGMSDAGVSQLFGFVSMSKVSSLDLDGNWNISSHGVNMLIEMMVRNYNLVSLSISDADFSKEQDSTIAHLRERNLIYQQFYKRELFCLYVSRYLKMKKCTQLQADFSFVSHVFDMCGLTRASNVANAVKLGSTVPYMLNVLISDRIGSANMPIEVNNNASGDELPQLKRHRVR
jgi:Ran GTPase-activating protein (RanGAP) involved in mRNA processing and transport